MSGADKAAHAKAAGADYIVNYKSDDVAQAVKDITKGQGVDRAIEVEFGGNLASHPRLPQDQRRDRAPMPRPR